jgi:hypothetical protein
VRPESTHDDLARDPELENNVPRSAKGHEGNLQNSESPVHVQRAGEDN